MLKFCVAVEVVYMGRRDDHVLLKGVKVSNGSFDLWKWEEDASGIYTVKSAYTTLHNLIIGTTKADIFYKCVVKDNLSFIMLCNARINTYEIQ